jgi:dTDP-4-amino-4,6-dideoxygalactose transaminase
MNWKVPLSDLSYAEDESKAVSDVIASRWLSMGPQTEVFEKDFMEFTGSKYAFAVSNCTAAMHIAHTVLGIGPEDEVIVPSLTFIATVNAILYTGARPVFADVKSLENWNICAEQIESLITHRTKAVVVVHYAGYPVDMTAVSQLCAKKNLMLIEDCAHSPGAYWQDKHTGTFGKCGCFSFFSNKNMATGEGGMIITDDGALSEKIRCIRSHGMTTLTWQRHSGHAYSYDVVDLGYNYRLDEIRSALGRVQLRKLNINNKRRGQLVELYREKLADVTEINIPFMPHPPLSSYHIFPILLDTSLDRISVINGMKEKGVQTSVHYPPAHLFTYIKRNLNTVEGQLPLTEKIGKGVLTLPLFPDMTVEQLQYVVDSLKKTVTL